VVPASCRYGARAAREADAAVARGDSLGPLHGVPMTVKDAWESRAYPPGWDAGPRRLHPQHDATVIQRMRAAGAIPIGMTNLPEMSMAFESDNLVHGRTNNPYDLHEHPWRQRRRLARQLSLGDESDRDRADLGVSIRLPCQFLWNSGIRPTTGRVPLTGYFPPCVSWVTICGCRTDGAHGRGSEGRTAVIAGPDWIDSAVHDVSSAYSRRRFREGPAGGVSHEHGIMPERADIAAVVVSAAKSLEAAGAMVEEAIPSGIDSA